MRITVSELIGQVGSSYQSIDIRAAIYEKDDHAKVLMVIVRLSYEDLAAAAARITSRREKYVTAKTPHFDMFFEVRSFDEWPQFIYELECGVLRINGSNFLLPNVNLGPEHVDVRVDGFEIRSFDGRAWPTGDVKLRQNSGSMLGSEELTRELSRVGYSDAFEAINCLFELNVFLGRSEGYGFYLSAPVFCRLEDVAVSNNYTHLGIRLERHVRLGDVQARVVLREGNFNQNEAIKRSLSPVLSVTGACDRGSLERVHSDINVADLNSDDWIEIRLVHPWMGQIASSSSYAYIFVRLAERNVLWHALKGFCKQEEFENLLVHAHSVKSKRLKESSAFELHVSWLFGLLGFATVVLGEYENLFAGDTLVKHGTVDLLASRQTSSLLVLAACTLNPPKEEDFSNLLYVADVLSRERFQGTNIRLASVVCTAATAGVRFKQCGEYGPYIPILDRKGLSSALKMVEQGQERRFLDFLASPLMSDLPELSV